MMTFKCMYHDCDADVSAYCAGPVGAPFNGIVVIHGYTQTMYHMCHRHTRLVEDVVRALVRGERKEEERSANGER